MEPSQQPAAPPLLASNLLSLLQSQLKSLPPPASAGLSTIDSLALSGGFKYGEITSIAGPPGTGKTLLGFQAIASHLLGTEGKRGDEVAFIDTSGAFNPVRLRDVLIGRLKRRRAEWGYACEDSAAKGVEGKAPRDREEATRLMDRVQVMRVFDFAGVVEALGEVGRMWDLGDEVVAEKRGRGKMVKDSQSEDENEIEDGNKEGDEYWSEVQEGQMGMIVVDTITNVVSSMVLKNQIEGQALLTTFMRSLRHLTSRRHMCTLLINGAVGLNLSNNQQSRRRPDDNASIFTSTVGKPAMGKSFAYLVDTSIFLSTVPKERRDAEIAYGGAEDGARWEKVGMLEVLKDRYGSREGQWAAFDVVSGVEMKNPP